MIIEHSPFFKAIENAAVQVGSFTRKGKQVQGYSREDPRAGTGKPEEPGTAKPAPATPAPQRGAGIARGVGKVADVIRKVASSRDPLGLAAGALQSYGAGKKREATQAARAGEKEAKQTARTQERETTQAAKATSQAEAKVEAASSQVDSHINTLRQLAADYRSSYRVRDQTKAEKKIRAHVDKTIEQIGKMAEMANGIKDKTRREEVENAVEERLSYATKIRESLFKKSLPSFGCARLVVHVTAD